MTTILRSSKYIRCLNVFARRIIISHDSSAIVNKKRFELQLAQCANSYLTKSYATKPAINRQENAQTSNDIFQELDNKIQRYGRVFRSEVESILSSVQDKGHMNSLDALLLIRCCGNLLSDTPQKERTQLANKIWSTLETLKVPLDVLHYNAMLRVYLENNHEFSPNSFLTTMENNGIEPNTLTYRRLILHHCKKGDIPGATEILESMSQKEIPLNEAIFSALIIGHSEANDLESAKNVLNVMKEAGIESSSITYSSLINAYAKRGDMAAIKQTLDNCEKGNIFFTDSDYFEVIQTLVTNNHAEKVEEILEWMPKGPNYNVDAVQAILKILDTGNIETALQILRTFRQQKKTKENSSENESGGFLIRKLVNAKYAPEDVVAACETLHREGLNTQSYLVALQRSLGNRDVDMSIALMEAWKRNGGEIRHHYFWPLLAYYGTQSNYQGILDIVKIMSTQFNIIPDIETISNFILPFTVGKWDDVISSLKEFKIHQNTIVTSIALRMLYDNRIRKTAGFMLAYYVKYDPRHFYRALTESTMDTSDAQSFAVILRLLSDFDENETLDDNVTKIDIVDTAVGRLLTLSHKKSHDVIDKVLDNMIKVGLSMSPEMGQQVRECLGDKCNSETDGKINQLTSGTLTPVPISELTELASRADFDNIHIQPNRSIFIGKRRELAEALEKRDVEKLKQVTEELEAQKFPFTSALYAQILDVYCSVGDLENAEKWRNKGIEANSDTFFDIQKSTDFAQLLIKNGRFDDAVRSIRDSRRKTLPQTFSPSLKRMIKKTLDTMAETGEVEKTNELFDAFLKSNYMEADSFMLGSLVKVHLKRNDYAGALEVFERICTEYRCTPYRNELTKVFIDAEDADALQKLTDLSTRVHGENNALIDLVFSFIECGRFRQARKILETPGLRLKDRRLEIIVERYMKDGRIEIFEQFFDLSKGLSFIDRQELYDVLMTAFDRRNKWQNGLNLWMLIQEEDIQPSRQFLKSLHDLLSRNYQPVPFTYDSSANDEYPDIDSKSNGFENLFNAIKENDLEKAKESLKNIAPSHPEYSKAVSTLMMAYLSAENNVDEALALANDLILKHRRTPRVGALKVMWHNLVVSGKTDELKNHGKILPTIVSKNLHFGKFLAQADLKDNGLGKFLENLELKLANSTESAFTMVKDSLPFKSLVEELKKDPSYIDKFKTIAEKFAEKQLYSPINILWCYYFEHNHPEADVIFDKYFMDSERVNFKYLLTVSRRENKIDLAERLYNQLKDSKVINAKTKLFVFCNVVDLYLTNGRIDEAIEIAKSLSPTMETQWPRLYPITYKKFLTAVQTSGKSLPSDDATSATQP